MSGNERILSCARCCMADCPHFQSSKMQAVCFVSPVRSGAESGKRMMSSYRDAESLCRDCPDYTPRGAA